MPAALSAPIVVVAPDSFKGAISAAGAAHAIANGIRHACPLALVRTCPMADGGEGTLDAMLAHGGTRCLLHVANAAGNLRKAAAGFLDTRTALIETAAIVGLTDRAGTRAPVAQRSTRGIGEAIRALLDKGARTFYIGLGGSSTNDAGAGLLTALGMRCFDAADQPFEPALEHFSRIARIDLSGLDKRLREATFIGLSDVSNPLLGIHGATAVFGPQKGVPPEHINAFDTALLHFANRLEAAFARSARHQRGAGAAGGLGFALALLGARLEAGAEIVAQRAGLDEALAGAHWLITGEGRSDTQTLNGKAPYVVAQHARAAGVPASLLSGAIDPAALPQLATHFSGCFSPAPGPISLDTAIRDIAPLLTAAAAQLMMLREDARLGR